MSRYINPETGGKERNRLTKMIILAIRELMQQGEVNDGSYDMVAFIILALANVYETIDSSVAAWEKKGYWLKADKYRLEWEWTRSTSQQMETALFQSNWEQIAVLSAKTASRLGQIKISPRHRMGQPWKGAWGRLKELRHG